jgi:hypothetical protein
VVHHFTLARIDATGHVDGDGVVKRERARWRTLAQYNRCDASWRVAWIGADDSTRTASSWMPRTARLTAVEPKLFFGDDIIRQNVHVIGVFQRQMRLVIVVFRCKFRLVLQWCMDRPAVGNSSLILDESPTGLGNVILILMQLRYCSENLPTLLSFVTTLQDDYKR